MSAKIIPRTFRTASIIRIPPRRTFISLPGTEPQSVQATRILPYKASSVYTMISDIDSYSTFVPYCLESKVTEWSKPCEEGKKWPQKADLKVGWGGFQETFTSSLYCVPNSVVEALSGDATTDLPKSSLQHHTNLTGTIQKDSGNQIFTSLSTRWVVKPFHYKPPSGQPQTDKAVHPPRDQTEVHLTIQFQFANPVYGALSKAVTPKVAGMMIEAFEVRARKILDEPGKWKNSRRIKQWARERRSEMCLYEVWKIIRWLGTQSVAYRSYLAPTVYITEIIYII